MGAVEGGDTGGLLAVFGCGAFLRCVLVFFEHFFDQESDDAFAFCGFADFSGWGEEAKFGVGGDLFDGFGLGFGVRFAVWVG